MPFNLLFLFFLSMLPIIELRGAIPIGLSWGLDFWTVYIVSVLGNLVPIPILIPFAGRVLNWGAKLPKIGVFFQKIIDIGNKRVEKAQKVNAAIMWGLFVFVAIPAPMTGAWTGCLIATLLQMKVRKAFLPIAAGVAVAGIIMGITSYGLFELIGII